MTMISRRAFFPLAFGAALSFVGAPLIGCSRIADTSVLLGQTETDTQSAQTQVNDLNEVSFFAFDTLVEIRARTTEEVLSHLRAVCERYESLFSRTREGSDVWNINHAQGEPVIVDLETIEIIQAAINYAELSGGLFDITIGGVLELWDFDAGIIPDRTLVDRALAHVGWQGVKTNRDALTVSLADVNTHIDLGGIAKGYIADALVNILLDAGCDCASLSLGGNVYVLGDSPDGDLWQVGVRNPAGQAANVVASYAAANTSIVTSGIYERSFTRDGVLYHHILDPATGFPAMTDLESATVVCTNSMRADVLSTILILQGKDAALAFAKENPDVEVLVVDTNKDVFVSDNASFVLV